MAGRERLQLGEAGHTQPVVGDQLAEHAGRDSPAMRARSTAASVWPARLSTPPSPGPQHMEVAGPVQVLGPGRRVDQRPGGGARSAAEIPVVVPCR